MKKFVFTLVLCSFIYSMNAAVADFVIYSFNRPLQLYALLESVEKYMQGVGETIVIYRTSDALYKESYSIVARRFPQVKFFEQSAQPKEDFKPLTLQATFNTPSHYVFFGVDDIVVKDYVDISECIDIMERSNAFGFYLRLGDHLNYAYTYRSAQAVPELTPVQEDSFSWVFAHSTLDWAYPHTVDMTVFRKNDIEKLFRTMEYNSPNTLEANWANNAAHTMNKKGVCFKNSKIVNLPLNRVQSDYNNESMEISVESLQDVFLKGYKMDIEPLFQVRNVSAHMEYEPTFVVR